VLALALAATVSVQALPTPNGLGAPVAAAPSPVAPTASWTPQELAGQQPLQVVCPPRPPGYQDLDPDDPSVPGCPIRVHDSEISFGSPALAVNPSNLDQVAFFSLGGSGVTGPTNRSRESPTHTIEASVDQGVGWGENPDYDPPSGALYGEQASGAMDRKGDLFAGFLWSTDPATRGGLLGLYRADHATQDPNDWVTYDDETLVTTRAPQDAIVHAWVIDVPLSNATFQPNATASGPHGSSTPASRAAAAGDPERIAAVWVERSPHDSPTKMEEWIDAAFRSPAPHTGWSRLQESHLIGPCDDASNPVAADGKVYVACVVGAGYTARDSANVGDVDMWRIDPLGGGTTFVASTRLSGGHPVLAAAPNGYMVVATARRTDQGPGTVHLAAGWHGDHWHEASPDLGPALHSLAGGTPQKDLAVTALAIAPGSNDILLIYHEWNPQPPASVPPPPTPGGVPQPAEVAPRKTDYSKVAYVLNECNAGIGALGFVLGTYLDPEAAEDFGQDPAMFDDDQDGLQTVHDPGGGDLFTFAVDDYGAVQYGAIVDPVTAAPCLVTPPILPLPPALPQALTVGTPAAGPIGALVGVAAVSMVLYLLSVKRKSTSKVAAKDD